PPGDALLGVPASGALLVASGTALGAETGLGAVTADDGVGASQAAAVLAARVVDSEATDTSGKGHPDNLEALPGISAPGRDNVPGPPAIRRATGSGTGWPAGTGPAVGTADAARTGPASSSGGLAAIADESVLRQTSSRAPFFVPPTPGAVRSSA